MRHLLDFKNLSRTTSNETNRIVVFIRQIFDVSKAISRHFSYTRSATIEFQKFFHYDLISAVTFGWCDSQILQSFLKISLAGVNYADFFLKIFLAVLGKPGENPNGFGVFRRKLISPRFIRIGYYQINGPLKQNLKIYKVSERERE